MRYLCSAVVLAAVIAAAPAFGTTNSGAHSSGSHASTSHSGVPHSAAGASTHASSKSSSHRVSGTQKSTYAGGARRDSHGKIARSEKSKDDFKKQHPCPSSGKNHGSCPGYVIDHVVPLKRGGADAPSNMQWQTVEAAKIKDRTE